MPTFCTFKESDTTVKRRKTRGKVEEKKMGKCKVKYTQMLKGEKKVKGKLV